MNISDPIPISSTGSNGSIGVDAARQRSNNTQYSDGTSRMDLGPGSLPQSGSSAFTGGGGSSSQYGSMPLGSPNERPSVTDSPSGNINMAGLALDVQNVPTPIKQQAQVVPVGFEEGTLRALCDLDCGFPLLMDRIKQSMASCRETSIFFKKRAQMEEDYARSLQKLTRERIDSYSLSDGKGGSFVGAYNALLRSHDVLAENHVKMAQQLSEMSEQLIDTAREVERSRKASKETGTRLERNLTDSESQTDKARVRFDASVEELERILISKAGENARDIHNMPSDSGHPSNHAGKRTLGKAIGKLKGGPKNPAQLQRMEEDARYKMNSLSDAYRQQVLATQTIRQEYFNLQLPRMLKSLKESLDEVDLATQFHLSRYAYLLESVLLNDGLTVAPPELGGSTDQTPGMKSISESIDNREDFKKFMQNYAVSFAASGQRVLRREGPPEEGFVRQPKVPNQLNESQSTNMLAYNMQGTSGQGMSQAQSYSQLSNQQRDQQNQQPPVYFGVDLGEQMERDNVDVPKVLQKCVETIEAHGMDSQGLYRLSGTTSRVQRLRARMEKDIDSLNLNSEENLTDINDITGVLKLFFRELPDPLFTLGLYQAFIEAARIDNARLRHIRLHERINELPDPNYATCKYFLGHLDRVRQHSDKNQMSVSNLAIVFGPTLLRAPAENASNSIQDMQYQYKAIETILEHYRDIFVEAEEEPDDEGTSKSTESPATQHEADSEQQTDPGLSDSSPGRSYPDNTI